jgi:hypothetical protein
MARQEPSHDRIGDRLAVNPILAETDLLLNLVQSHVAKSFSHVHRLPDKSRSLFRH